MTRFARQPSLTQGALNDLLAKMNARDQIDDAPLDEFEQAIVRALVEIIADRIRRKHAAAEAGPEEAPTRREPEEARG